METQKTLYIPTVNGVPIKDWDATEYFVTDPIEFPYSIPWSYQFYSSDSWTPGGAVYGVLHSNTTNINDSQYYNGKQDLALNNPNNLTYQNSFFGSRYMFMYYSPAGGESGTFTIQISK